ncbi:programmed cell death protein 4-like [Dioscorea cayenensis subsp. rotundata]|uniref:Programmed cell death protein 4-like n=1 Tax=Dioscorea cayennensis subsp. rotundata TaxID=55577 RepID=A0AB40CWD1_DIOCR|nr:programmed cell death protein 4-like [Dioscorea cayenensis subsp. rotundata]
MEKKKSRGSVKGNQGGRRDRRSATGMNGEPKKGGHGGKFTWVGTQTYSEKEFINGVLEIEAVDAKDPNFEDPLELLQEVA